MYRIMILAVVLSGCSTINVTVTGDSNRIQIEQPKTVTATPYVSASGNTVPVSAVP